VARHPARDLPALLARALPPDSPAASLQIQTVNYPLQARRPPGPRLGRCAAPQRLLALPCCDDPLVASDALHSASHPVHPLKALQAAGPSARAQGMTH